MFKVDYSVLFWSDTEEDWKWEENKGEAFSSENKEEAEAFIQEAIEKEKIKSDYIYDVTHVKYNGVNYTFYSLTDRRIVLGVEKHVWTLSEIL